MLQFMKLIWKPVMYEVCVLRFIFPWPRNDLHGHLDSCAPFADSSSFFCTLGLRPLAFSLLYTHFPGVVPSILKTFSFTYVLMTSVFVFPPHISPLNTRPLLPSPPGCLRSIFKHKLSRTELLFFPPSSAPPLPYRSSGQVYPSMWLRSNSGFSFSFTHILQPIQQQALCFYL